MDEVDEEGEVIRTKISLRPKLHLVPRKENDVPQWRFRGSHQDCDQPKVDQPKLQNRALAMGANSACHCVIHYLSIIVKS